jgi:hypothetical protein
MPGLSVCVADAQRRQVLVVRDYKKVTNLLLNFFVHRRMVPSINLQAAAALRFAREERHYARPHHGALVRRRGEVLHKCLGWSLPTSPVAWHRSGARRLLLTRAIARCIQTARREVISLAAAAAETLSVHSEALIYADAVAGRVEFRIRHCPARGPSLHGKAAFHCAGLQEKELRGRKNSCAALRKPGALASRVL